MKKTIPPLTIVTVIGALLLWEGACYFLKIPEYLLPAPHVIVSKLYKDWQVLLHHFWFTLIEVILGFVIGAVSAFLIAIGISLSKNLSEILYPLLVVTQVVPKIALAPLFLIWFGYGLLPKVIITVLISFFPVVINTVLGLTFVGSDLLDLMKSLSATPWQVFKKIRFPNAVPYIFSALKISILFSIVGAITGEFVGADKGLGYLIIIGNTTLDTALVFAAISLISSFGILAFWALSSVQNYISKRHGFAFTKEGEVVSSL